MIRPSSSRIRQRRPSDRCRRVSSNSWRSTTPPSKPPTSRGCSRKAPGRTIIRSASRKPKSWDSRSPTRCRRKCSTSCSSFPSQPNIACRRSNSSQAHAMPQKRPGAGGDNGGASRLCHAPRPCSIHRHEEETLMAMTTINPATGDPMVMLHTWRWTAIDAQFIVTRIVKIFELAFLLELTPRPSLALRLVFCTPLTHTHRQYGRYRLRGRGDGLETPARVYHGDRRSGTVVTQRVPGDGESHAAQPDHGPGAVDGWRT